MASLEQALELARRGFFIFPLIQGSKLPAIEGWQKKASRNEERIRKWWVDPVLELDQDWNIGVFTGAYGENEALIVVDIDTKGEKNGYTALLELELQGFELQPTYEVSTPTGGKHLYYRTAGAVKQGANVLGLGVDIRSHGGFVVGPASTVEAGAYVATGDGIADAPDWLPAKCGTAKEREAVAPTGTAAELDQERAVSRAIDYLAAAPVAIEGEGGDQTTFHVALKLKDLGLDSVTALKLLDIYWNDQCQPPWSFEALEDKVRNAYKYGKQPVGVAAPETQFPPVEEPSVGEDEGGVHPLEKLNREYAFVIAGGTGNILWESTDFHGQYAFQLLNKTTVADRLASYKFQTGKKMEPLFNAWMEWPKRRTYDGIVFEPGVDAGPRWYNMWRGFSTQPAPHANHPMVERWKEHLLENACQGNTVLADWLTCWFAQLIQQPGVKPLVAVAFKGSKGTGKNALVERVKHLLGGHGMVTSRRRYLVSNFTMHLQKCLLFVLDEAFWSGDKEAEGVVKDLITGSRHVIEPKGKESYEVRNLTRVAVIGNEEWIVPASADERRWAVFEMGEGKKQKREYFEELRVGLDQEGGDAYLLRYLLDYPITQDVNAAPSTKALMDQKFASLEPFEQWWMTCLLDGRIVGSEFGDEWVERISTDRFQAAFSKYAKERNIKGRLPDQYSIGRALKKVAPDHERKKASRADHSNSTWVYVLGPLDSLRQHWETVMGGAVSWGH